MKLKKKRLLVVLIILVVISVVFIKIYSESKKIKTVDLGQKELETYDIYSRDEIDSIFNIETHEMYFSTIELDLAMLKNENGLDSITIKEDGILYLLNDTHLYKVLIKSQDTNVPEIFVTKGDDPIDSIQIPYNSRLGDYIKVEAFDTQNGIKTNILFEISHSLEDTYSEDIKVNITATDGVNSVAKTLEVIVEEEIVVAPEKPSGNSGNTNLITTNLDRIDILVNKSNMLPSSFVPKLTYFPAKYAVSEGYRAHPEAAFAYMQLVDTMNAEIGEWMYVTSSYRDYEFQGKLYNNAIKSMGFDKASMLSAKPGASEHQTGLAIDVVTSGVSMYDFGSTKQSDWVDDNAHRFGFIVRYQSGYESITGYNAEPWHLRYLGKDLAAKVYNLKVPYENVVNQ